MTVAKQVFIHNDGSLDATAALLDKPKKVGLKATIEATYTTLYDTISRRESTLRTWAASPGCHDERRQAYEAEADGLRWALRTMRRLFDGRSR